jgi:hypothetical protein
VSGARQRSGGVEKYSSIASRSGARARLDGDLSGGELEDQRRAQLMQTPARSIPQPVQLQLDL